MTVRNFRYLAIAEAISFLVLLAGSGLKRADVTELGVSIMGPIHGILFVAYAAFALSLRKPAGWSYQATFWILVGAVVPFGGFVVDWWLARNHTDELAAT
jgi:integral membrane protein